MKKLALVLLGCLGSLSLMATALPNPGGPVTPTLDNNVGTKIDWRVSGFSAGQATGIFRQGVYLNASTGFYDFYYQVQVNSNQPANPPFPAVNVDPVTQLILRGFSGFTTDVFFTDGSTLPANDFGNNDRPTNPGPFVTPTAGLVGLANAPDMSQAGGTITANFGNPGLTNGQASNILIVRTNASGWTVIPSSPGINNNPANGQQFAPTPEPSFYAAVTLGLAGLFLARRRKAQAQIEE